MLENKDLTPSEQLTAFLDGELTTDEASTLFYSLAQNPELQEEMRQQIAIKNTFKANLVIPPELLHAKILDKTGLSDDSGFTAFGKLGQSFKWLLSKRAAWISTGILLIALLSWYLSLSNNSTVVHEIASSKLEKNNNAATNYPIVSSRELKPNVNKMSSDANRLISANKPSAHRVHNYSSSSDHSNSQSGFATINQTDNQTDSENRTAPFDNVERRTSINKAMPYEAMASLNMRHRGYQVVPVSLLNRSLENVSMNLKFAGPFMKAPSFSIPNDNPSILDQFTLSFIYSLDNHHAFGIDLGRENYLMQFDKYYGDTLMNITQSYSAFWIGANYRYSFNPIESLGQSIPYVGVTTGANNVGAICKVDAGMKYYAFDGIAVIGGVEYGILLYKNDGQLFDINSSWYATSKLNVFLGFSFGVF